MKILFVFYNYGSGLAFHNGIALLSAIAKREGHQTELLHFHDKLFPDDKDAYISFVKGYDPDLIAFTSTDFEYKHVNRIAKDMKEALPEATFLLGGKAAIEIATKDLSNTPFDVFSVGEAEIPFIELLNHLSKLGSDEWDVEKYSQTKSFWFKTSDGSLIKNKLGEIVTDLDSLPYYDYDLFNTEEIIKAKGGWISIQFTRGCAYNCTYCYVTADKATVFDKTQSPDNYGMDKYLRKNSAEWAIKFLEYLCEKWGDKIECVNLDDELPTMYKQWFLEFCSKFKERIYEKYGIEFTCNSRINITDVQLIKAMSESGCREVRMGFECGSYRIRRDVLHKPIPEEMMKEVYANCDRYSLYTTSFTMIGIPEEQISDIQETFRLTAELKPYLIRLTFCYPFENTLLWKKYKHMIRPEKYMEQMGYFEESPLIWDGTYSDMTEQQLMAFRFLFPWYVNQLMDLPEQVKLMYSQLVELYKDKDFKDQGILNDVIAADKVVREHELLKDKEHYGYFDKALGYYHCYNKKYPKVRPIVKKKSKSKEAEVVDCKGFNLPWTGDDNGYFLIRYNIEEDCLEAGFCKNDSLSVVSIILKGTLPHEIYNKICQLGLVTRYEHAAYLGKELSRCYVAHKLNKPYIQDNGWEDIFQPTMEST